MSVRKVLPVILAAVGGAGVVATAVCAVKNTTKYGQLPKPDNKQDTFKQFVKCYWPTILVGSATVASIVTGTIISQKTEAALTASVAALATGYKKYQGKVIQTLGPETHNNIVAAIAKDECEGTPNTKGDKILWYEDHIGRFYATEADVYKAVLNLNYRICSYNSWDFLPKEEIGVATFDLFVKDANAEILDEDKFNAWKEYGWSTEYLSDEMEDVWLMDGYHDETLDNENVRVLVFNVCEPIFHPIDYDHNEHVMAKSEKWHGTNIQAIQEEAKEEEHE